MLSCFFKYKKKKKKKIAKGLDRTVLTGSSGPIPVLTVHGINKKSGSLGLKNRFSSRFPVFTVRPPGPVRFCKQWRRPTLKWKRWVWAHGKGLNISLSSKKKKLLLYILMQNELYYFISITNFK